MTLSGHSKRMQYIGFWPISPARNKAVQLSAQKDRNVDGRGGKKAHEFITFTCVLGKAEVRSVSCVSSAGFLLGTLRTKAA